MQPEHAALVVGPGAETISAPVEDLYRQEVSRARAMTPEEKLLAGERLFLWACEITLAGIRDQQPGLTEDQCLEELQRRLAMRRRWELAA